MTLVTETPNGIYRRNRRHIIPMPDTEPSVKDNANSQFNNDISDLETPESTSPTNDTDTVKTRSGRTVKPPNRLDTSWTL